MPFAADEIIIAIVRRFTGGRCLFDADFFFANKPFATIAIVFARFLFWFNAGFLFANKAFATIVIGGARCRRGVFRLWGIGIDALAIVQAPDIRLRASAAQLFGIASILASDVLFINEVSAIVVIAEAAGLPE